jgi:hypothetical protein
MPDGTRDTTSTGRWLPILLGIAVLALAFLPLADWTGVGGDRPPWRLWVDFWTSGAALAMGGGVVLAMVQQRGVAALAAPGRWLARAAAWADAQGGRWPWLLALAVLPVYALLAWVLFDGRPLSIDEIVQLLQARIFEEGRLFRPAPAHPEFLSTMHVLDGDGRWFGQFPPGWPLLLLPFDLAHAAWLAGPVLGAATVVAFGAWLRSAEPDPVVRFLALVLFALSPFTAVQAASHMNHLPATAFVLAGAAALLAAARTDGGRPAMTLLAGLCFGAAATIRPLDAAAFAFPAGLWLTWRAVRAPRRAADVIALVLGAAIPAAGLLWYNAQTTGAPLLFAYDKLWGEAHRIGFHATPWGPAHTPMRGLGQLGLAFARLNIYGFESLLPALLPAGLALLLWPGLRAADRYLAAAAAFLCLGYWAYWHDGFYLGPRFFLPLWPLIVWWIARVPSALSRLPRGGTLAGSAAGWSLVVGIGAGAVALLPDRLSQYRGGLLSMRWHEDDLARDAGATGGLVFVRESWGAEIIAKMWALDVGRPETEQLYRTVDICRLDRAVDSLAAQGLRGPALRDALRPLTADSARLVRDEEWADVHYLPGAAYPPHCREKIARDRTGTTSLAPRLLARDGTVYVRSIGARDTLMLDVYPDRPVFLLRPAGPEVGSPLRFVPLDRQAVRAAARRDGRGAGDAG